MPDAASQYGLILIALAYAVVELIKSYSNKMMSESARLAREELARGQQRIADDQSRKLDEQNKKLDEQTKLGELTHTIVNSQRTAMEAAIARLSEQVLELNKDKARLEGEIRDSPPSGGKKEEKK